MSSSRTQGSTCSSASTRAREARRRGAAAARRDGDVHYLTAADAYCTRRSSASSPATRSRTRTTGTSTRTSSISRPWRRWRSTSGHEDAMRRTLEVAERCSLIELGNIRLPRFDAGRSRRLRVSRRAVRARARAPLRQGDRSCVSGSSSSSRRPEMSFADYFLIVWDFIHFAKVNGSASARAEARPLARGLLARDHRHRSDPLRPALRALPESGPQGDAGHRHRLAVEGRERVINYVSEKYGRDRVARSSPSGRWPPGRGARCGPRARDPLRRRRQGREADPGIPGQTLADCLKPGSDLKNAYDTERREGDHRSREAAEASSAGLDPRSRGRHRRRAADRRRPAPAEGLRPEIVTQFSMNTVRRSAC